MGTSTKLRIFDIPSPDCHLSVELTKLLEFPTSHRQGSVYVVATSIKEATELLTAARGVDGPYPRTVRPATGNTVEMFQNLGLLAEHGTIVAHRGMNGSGKSRHLVARLSTEAPVLIGELENDRKLGMVYTSLEPTGDPTLGAETIGLLAQAITILDAHLDDERGMAKSPFGRAGATYMRSCMAETLEFAQSVVDTIKGDTGAFKGYFEMGGNWTASSVTFARAIVAKHGSS